MSRVRLRLASIMAVTAATVTAAAAGATAGTPLSEDECRAVWNTAAGRSDLSAEGARPYVDSFESVDTNRDMKINNPEFKAGCKAGFVHKFRKPEAQN